eukprot:16262823-Heterocapsa_arctica.AAC.1
MRPSVAEQIKSVFVIITGGVASIIEIQRGGASMDSCSAHLLANSDEQGKGLEDFAAHEEVDHEQGAQGS